MGLKLSNKFVAALAPGEMMWDSDPRATGFGVRAYGGGGRSFFIDYRINGRQRRYTIGPHPRWSADAARQEAIELRKKIDKGQDPAGDKRERRTAPTIQDLIDRYVSDHLPKKTQVLNRVVDEKRMAGEIAKHLGKYTKVADIHGGDIREMHRKISESIGRSGPRRIRANRVLSLASKMFSLSLVPRAGETKPWRDAQMGNPCRGVERNREQGRERFFSPLELAKISDGLTEYDGSGADCIRLILLTGCRPSEAMTARWADFDTEGFWVKPASTTKQRKVHKLPLSPAAIELVDRLREKRHGDVVFPGPKGRHLETVKRCWRFVKEHAGLEKTARVYDLRHSFASVGAGGGLSLPIIGKLLGHSVPNTTQRYAHLADDPLREAAEKIGRVITGAGKPGAPILPLGGSARGDRRS